MLRISVLSCILVFAVGSSYGQSFPSLVSKCDFCIASQGITPLEMGRTAMRYDVRYLKMSRVYNDGTLSTNEEQENESFFTSQFTMSYSVAQDVTLVGILPYVSRTGSRLMDEEDARPGETLHVSNSGLGDMIGMLRYNLISEHSYNQTRVIALSAGAKLPTGSTNFHDVTGAVADPDLQCGSGSLDWLMGMSVLLGTQQLAFTANATGALAGRGANDHSYGNNLNYDASIRYQLYCKMDDCAPSLYGTLGFSGEWRGHEIENGELIENSGGNVLYLTPGFEAFITPAITIDARFEQPIIHALNGEQLGETYRIRTGVQYLF